jgi:hypothetical protein
MSDQSVVSFMDSLFYGIVFVFKFRLLCQCFPFAMGGMPGILAKQGALG